jgi:hypothetical protein
LVVAAGTVPGKDFSEVPGEAAASGLLDKKDKGAQRLTAIRWHACRLHLP